jgi:hypothetical protein
LLIRRGADTLVVDRFFRNGDTLAGIVRVKGQPRVDYLAVLGPGEAVRSLEIGIFALDATPNAVPAQRIRMFVEGDSVIAETPTGIQQLRTSAGAIPMFNNALALAELFTRRARAAGGTADIPYFAISNGQTLTASVRPVGADSLTLAVASQVQRLKVDGRGRILGGAIAGSGLELARLGPEAADQLNVSLRDKKGASPPELR